MNLKRKFKTPNNFFTEPRPFSGHAKKKKEGGRWGALHSPLRSHQQKTTRSKRTRKKISVEKRDFSLLIYMESSSAGK